MVIYIYIYIYIYNLINCKIFNNLNRDEYYGGMETKQIYTSTYPSSSPSSYPIKKVRYSS